MRVFATGLLLLALASPALAQQARTTAAPDEGRSAQIRLNLCRLQLQQSSDQMASELAQALTRAEQAEAKLATLEAKAAKESPKDDGK